MMGEAGQFLLALGSNPWAIAAAIVLATFVLEDVATIAAAVLAADGLIGPWAALAALITGIFVGDLVLYGAGAYARTNGWAKRMIGEKRMDKGRAWLKRRYVPALIGARFMPGLRLPTYTSSGFLALPFAPFAAVAAGAGLIWTSAIFSLVYFFGAIMIEHLGMWRWSLAAVLLVCVIFAPYVVRRILPADTDAPHG
jgi:membrane protein DedA with SNARE-associated domain